MPTIRLYVVRIARLANTASVRLLDDGRADSAFTLRDYITKAIYAYDHHDYITAIAITSILDYRVHNDFGNHGYCVS